MKVIVITLACVLACVSALPNQHGSEIESAIRSGDSRIVTGSIVSAIEDLAQGIRDAGLDPLNIDYGLDYALPVPSIFNTRAQLRDFEFSGLSNIVVNRMNYAVLTSRLTFNIELPAIVTEIGLAQWDTKFFDRQLNGRIGGRVSVNNIVLAGDVRVSLGVISGISIRSMDLTFSLGSIDSNLDVVLQGTHLSRLVNTYLAETLPGTLNAYKSDIDELITIVARDIADSIL